MRFFYIKIILHIRHILCGTIDLNQLIKGFAANLSLQKQPKVLQLMKV